MNEHSRRNTLLIPWPHSQPGHTSLIRNPENYTKKMWETLSHGALRQMVFTSELTMQFYFISWLFPSHPCEPWKWVVIHSGSFRFHQCWAGQAGRLGVLSANDSILVGTPYPTERGQWAVWLWLLFVGYEFCLVFWFFKVLLHGCNW